MESILPEDAPPLSVIGLRSVYAVHQLNESIDLDELEDVFIKQVGYVASITPLRKGYIVQFYDSDTVQKALDTKITLKDGSILQVKLNSLEVDSKYLRSSTKRVMINSISKGANRVQLSEFLDTLIKALPLPRRKGELDQLIEYIVELVQPID